MKIGLENIVSKNSQAVETTVGSETVLMVVESGQLFGLGETGSEVWKLLMRPTQVSALIDSLCETYDAPREVIQLDVLELLDTLRDQKLVEVQ